MKQKNFKNTKYMNLALPLLIVLLLLSLFWFSINSLNIVTETNKNNFEYTIKVRNAIEEMDKIVERAELNLKVFDDVSSKTYDINKKNDTKYNIEYLKGVEVVTKSLLVNTPGVDGSWVQLNIDLPHSAILYNWFEFKDGKIINLKSQFKDKNIDRRNLNPIDDPYYFQAVKAKKLIWTDIYTDTDTKVPMITISEPIYKNGVLIGVAGIDVSIKNLQQAIKNMQATFAGSEIYLLDTKMNVLLYKLSGNDKLHKNDFDFLNLFNKDLKNQEAAVEYIHDGVRKTAIMLALSNKYNIVIAFPDAVIYKGYDRLFKTLYFIFSILALLGLLSILNKLKLIKSNKALEDEKNKLKTIIDSAPSLILVKNMNGVYIDCNQKFLDVMGIKKEEFAGKTDYDLFDEARAKEAIENDKIVTETKKLLIRESYYIDKEENNFYVEKYIIPMLDSEENITGILIIGYDITKRHQEQELLQKAKEAAEKTTEMKSSFLANMSHEIRTPMNGVLGFLQLLEETDTTDIQREFIADAQKSSELLLNIINEILDFSKIEADKLQIDNISFDIRSAVEDITGMAISNAYLKNLEISSLICSDVPQKVFGDPGRVKQVLNNLVGNAIKFTNNGEVLIYVNKVSETDDDVTVSFKVKDTGVGIAEDKLKLIFESFTQADASTTRKFGGTGLGLAISSKLANLMGGNISVESIEGEGSTFTLTLQFKKDKTINESVNPPIELLNGKTILIINDNPTDLAIIKHYLGEVNCIIKEAHSIEEALAVTNQENNNISVALIDYKMQNKDGIELSTLIKSGDYAKDIQLILYASLSKRGDAILAKQMGFKGYLTKPIKKNELIESIAIALDQNNNQFHKNFITKHLIKENKFDSKAKVLVVEDSELNCKLILKILTNAGLSCDIALDGLSALESFKTKKYDLILMDCEMPILDGCSATKEIRKLEGENHIPIIAMTANVLNSDKEKCQDSGMDDYLSKPINISKLLTTISKYIKLEIKKTETVENAYDVNQSEYIESIINEMKIELEFTRCEAIQLFDQYLEMLPIAISDMKNAIEQSDYEKLRRMAHKLRGSSSNMRVEKIAQLSEWLQNAAQQEEKDSCLILINEIKKHLEDSLKFAKLTELKI